MHEGLYTRLNLIEGLRPNLESFRSLERRFPMRSVVRQRLQGVRQHRTPLSQRLLHLVKTRTTLRKIRGVTAVKNTRTK
jgi:hypothetical protein